MRNQIAAFIDTLNDENHSFVKGKAVDHGSEGIDLIRLTFGIAECIDITTTIQNVQYVKCNKLFCRILPSLICN